MRFDLTVHADTPAELREALDAVAAALPENLFSGRKQFSVIAQPEQAPEQDIRAWHARNAMQSGAMQSGAMQSGAMQSGAMLSAPETSPTPAANDENAAPTPAADVKPTRGRGRPPKSTTAPTPAPAAPVPAPVAEDEPSADDEAVGSDEPGDEPGLPLDPEPAEVLAPAAAKLKALGILQVAYARPNGAAAVKALQLAYGVKKFVEIPDADGAAFLAKAEALLAALPETDAA